MRDLRLIVFLSIAVLSANMSLAQDRTDDTVLGAQPTKDDSQQLDELFTALSSETKLPGARRIARDIWRIWTESDSDTINLLMEWTSKAIREEKYALAQDLLTQVTTLQPDYVEGWNRRATLNYLVADYGRSLSDIERTLQLEPRHFGALIGLASILQKTQQDERALETWYSVLKIYPANERAQEAVIELEEKLAGEGI